MSNTKTEVDQSVVQDNGEIWAIDKGVLGEKLSEYYGVEGLEWRDEFHYGRNGVAYEALVYVGDVAEDLVSEGCRGLGHGPSGSVGVDTEYLPSKPIVDEVVSRQ